MAGWSSLVTALKKADSASVSVLRTTVMALALVSGLAILVMIAVTTTDVVMRILGRSLTGAYDIVKITGAVAIACALPYTTAVKGHVAIEYFFHKLRRPGRLFVDTLSRLLVICFFLVASYQTFLYGVKLKQTGQVSLTLQWPIFPVAYVISGALAVTVLVKVYNLLHPGREMIKP